MNDLKELIELTNKFIDEMRKIRLNGGFGEKIAHCYNPLEYAGDVFINYLKKYGVLDKTLNDKKIIKKNMFLGMNPGPFGMVQTGIPFGEVNAVKDWLKLEGDIKKPDDEFSKREILGFDCARSEVSGRRFWSLFENKFKQPEIFFMDNFVLNYCPLAFFSKSGANITPDKIDKSIRGEIENICDEYLNNVILFFQVKNMIGVGVYAEKSCLRIKKKFNLDINIFRILHPSPASPKANSGWEELAFNEIKGFGIWNNL